MTSPTDHRLALLSAEVQDLRHELRRAISHLPKSGRRWISTSELAAEVGVSSRAILKWLAAGRFPESAYRKRPRGQGFVYVLDRDSAVAAAERIICGVD